MQNAFSEFFSKPPSPYLSYWFINNIPPSLCNFIPLRWKYAENTCNEAVQWRSWRQPILSTPISRRCDWSIILLLSGILVSTE
jgi:hypothetical protein